MEQIEKALAHFQTILQEQFKRLETMDKPKKDFSKMDTITIGENSNVQDNCVIHEKTTVGKGCSIGHGAILHGCTVGDHCVVGMGAIVLNGAKLGNHCMVGAGAVVTGKMDAPDGSLLLGNPAKIVKEVTTEMIEEIKKDAALYIQLARRGL